MNKMLGLMSMVVFAAGCDKKVTDADDIPDGVATGELQVLLDATADEGSLSTSVEEVWLRFEDILVQHEDRGWISIGEDRADVDLMALRGGEPIAIGTGDVYEGAYDAIQLLIADSWIVVDGQEESLTIASGFDLPGDGVDFAASLFVDESTATSVLIGWSLDEELSFDGDGWILGTDATVNVDLE
jgi:hypothetical protein